MLPIVISTQKCLVHSRLWLLPHLSYSLRKKERAALESLLAGGGVSGQEGQIGLAGIVVKEKILPGVAELGDAVRAAHGHHAPNPCHRKCSGATGETFSRERRSGYGSTAMRR